ncbi:MAG: hypothetical protein E6K81_01240 [Candidatus Eisenbacteria bacterium]|uniref:Type II secretion system protein GspF domain-containing protein n=1 Tax=Eiseniibacteriota bacterium TaxID=2212470 RepID=A0A538UDX0_UNCEI|nr:MAG: hypothetical protein E6K81_01240 [Candidatus Eisenbacteria bacterium]
MFLAFAVLLFLAIVFGAAAVMAHHGGAGARALQGRLLNISRRTREAPKLQVERDVRYSSIDWLDTALRRVDIAQRLEMLIYQSGMSMRVGVLLFLIACSGMAGYFTGILAFHRVAPAVLFMVLGAPIPYAYVRYRKGKRMRSFAQEFPDALDLLVSALRAGLSFSAAMQIVAEESPDPVRGEFATTVEEQSLGLDFRETLVNLTRRVDSLDLRFFVTAVMLQRDTGGNLAEILQNTSALIRDRFRILGEIQTFTAQGRLTGWILLCLPLSIGLFMFVTTPEYFRPMIEGEAGLVIRKIVNIRV